MRARALVPALVLAAALTAPAAAAHAKGDVSAAALWSEPSDIASRDLFYGPGGKRLAPRSDAEYRIVGYDKTGHSHGYDVQDKEGRRWAVKLGEEAQSDVVVSRILWAIGYRQPITYYVPRWRIAPPAEDKPAPARFRLSSDHKVTGEWAWSDNPFVASRPLHGLIVANLILNNWDLTTSNNRTYKVEKPGKGPERWYVVQDVGGSLGRTWWPIGTRNNLEDFESEELIRKVEDGKVKFAYKARHQALVSGIPPEDVAWTCRLLSRLSDRQLDDAFRAAGYAPAVRERYVRKIRDKIKEGVALEGLAERSR
jgi:hypothetical protein